MRNKRTVNIGLFLLFLAVSLLIIAPNPNNSGSEPATAPSTTEAYSAPPTRSAPTPTNQPSCTAPCIYADEYGYASLHTSERDIVMLGDFVVDVTENGTEIHFYGGYELSELTSVETAEWLSISFYANGQHVVGCNGSRTLSQEQIERFRTWDGSAYPEEGSSAYMEVCHAARELTGS